MGLGVGGVPGGNSGILQNRSEKPVFSKISAGARFQKKGGEAAQKPFTNMNQTECLWIRRNSMRPVPWFVTLSFWDSGRRRRPDFFRYWTRIWWFSQHNERYFWRFWFSFLIQKLWFYCIAGEVVPKLNSDVFPGDIRWINQNDEILALKQLVNNQRDCLGTPTSSPRLRVVQRRGKVFSSGLEWSDWSTESGRRQAASRKTEIYMRQRKVRKMRQIKDGVGGGGVPGGNSGILNMIREIPGF